MKSPNEFPKAYQDAVFNRDVEAYTDLYDKETLLFDMWDDWSMAGQDACRKMAVDWFGSLKDERVKVTFSEVRIVESSELALFTAFVRFAAQDLNGNQLRYLDERITVTLRKNSSRDWKVVHQHTSTPVDSNGLKAILQRA